MGGQSLMPLSLDVDGETLRFFDYWLKGMDDGLSAEPPVRLFVMGEDVWRSENEWPLARAVETEFSSAAAVTPTRSRATARSRMKRRVTTGRMLPLRPLPSGADRRRATLLLPGDADPGAFDQRPVEARSDVLVYTTSPLEEDTEVTGPVQLHLWAATSAPDTDFTGSWSISTRTATRATLPTASSAPATRGDAPRPITPGRSGRRSTSGQPAISSAGGTASVWK